MIIADKRIRTRSSSDLDRFMSGGQREGKDGDGFQSLGMLSQRTIVSNHGHIKSQFESDWTRIAKAPPGNDGNSHSALARCCKGIPIPF